ncbi:hypothetical protein [Pectinatus frisingensis]|uniref:hypothetical protein n=1 Tax=Pectinatus frisingensis TaxID=865 RepID=UPI0018C68052|nr:hypothetical protein [Pectinatus frisingensis]
MSNNSNEEFENTRKIEPVSQHKIIGAKRHDIEIEDANNTKHGRSLHFWQKRISSESRLIILAAVFVIALLCGFLLSSYYNDKQQMAENDNIHQQQMIDRQRSDIKMQQRSLEQQRQHLEDERKELYKQSDEDTPQSFGEWLGSVADKISGKTPEREKAKIGATAKRTTATAEIQSKIDEINSSLAKLETTGQQLSQLQQNLSDEYHKNKDAVTLVKTYLQSILP